MFTGGKGGGGGGGGAGGTSAKLCLGDGETDRLTPPLVIASPETAPRLFLRLVFFLVYEDKRTPFLESIFLLFFLSSCLTGILDGSKLNVESSR